MTLEARKEGTPRYPYSQVMPISKGMDVSSLDGSILKGFGRIRENIDFVGGRVKRLPAYDRKTYATAYSPVPKAEYGVGKIWHEGKQYAFYAVNDTGRTVYALEIGSTNFQALTGIAGGDPSTMRPFVEGVSKLYAETAGGVFVIDRNTTNTAWAVRGLGLPTPEIISVSKNPIGEAYSMQKGTYQYGAEYVVKEGGVVVRSSGISRLSSVTGAVLAPFYLDEDDYGTTVVVDEEGYADYTHVRVWRSKNLDVNPDTGLIDGLASALYLVGESARGVGTSISIQATVPDTSLPYLALGELLPTTPEVLELYAMSSANKIGVVNASLTFVSGLPDDPTGIYGSAGRYGARYSEQINLADRTGIVASGDVLGLYGFGEDLVVRTEGGLWRLPYGDIDNSFIFITRSPEPLNPSSISVVTGKGLYILGKDYRLGYLDTNFKWNGALPSPIGEASDALFEGATSLYMNRAGERLRIIKNGEVYVLLPEGFVRQGDIATTYFGTLDGEAGHPTLLHNPSAGNVVADSIGKGTVTKYVSRISAGPFQAPKGDGIVEACSVRVETETNTPPTMELSCTEVGAGDTETRTTAYVQVGKSTYEYHIVARDPLPTRLTGQRIFALLTLSEDLDSVEIKGFIQEKGLVAVSPDTDINYQADFLSGQVMRFTQPSPTTDYWGNGSLQ